MPKPAVAFRVDASVSIGAGHVMRCLTLADALRDKGFACYFFCRDLVGHMVSEIAGRGHNVTLLPTPIAERRDTWLGVDCQFDASQCASAISEIMPKWLVVDHYGLDQIWEEELQALGPKIMVIDDLSNRPHMADLLLDQTHARHVRDYFGLVPDTCEILCGAQYALLRPTFAELRKQTLSRRHRATAKTLLLSMGGYDANNATGRIVDFLSTRKDLPFKFVDVVLGSQAPWLDDVRRQIRTLPFHAALHVDTPAMPNLIAQADLCIGAAGTSAWERCALGLPSILVVLADNQVGVAEQLTLSGAALSAGRIDEGFEIRFQSALTNALQPGAKREMSKSAAEVTDGKGIIRLIDAMDALGLEVYPASISDAPDVWHWRFEGCTASFYRHAKIPTFEQHLDWFSSALADENRMLLIISGPDGPIGHVRFDLQPNNEATVGICLAPHARGRSLSSPVLQAALAYARRRGVLHVNAEVHQDNLSSLALFRRVDFIETSIVGAFVQFRLTLPARGEKT